MLNINYYIGEIFLSLALFLQLIYGSMVVRKSTTNYFDIKYELFKQSTIIFSFLIAIYVISYYNVYEWLILNNNGILVDKIILSIIAMVLMFFFPEALKIHKINFYEYFSIYFIALLSLLLMLDSNDLIMFYLTMEIQALCFYVLASINRANIFSIEAGLKYFIVGAFFSALFLLGTVLIYGTIGSINLFDISEIVQSNLLANELQLLLAVGALLVISTLLFKTAAFPFHFWMVDVYEGAPLISTLVFSILPKFSLIYFLVKLLICFGSLTTYFQDILVIFGVLATLLGTLFAIRQLKTKRMFLYSSIAQIGFIIAAIGINSENGYFSVFYFVLIYLLTSFVMWGMLIAFQRSSNLIEPITQDLLKPLYISKFSKFIKSTTFWVVVFIVAFFSIGGIPPFVGFLSKFFVLEALLESNYYGSAIALIVISSISVYYYIRILKISFFEPKKLLISYTNHYHILVKTFFLETYIITAIVWFLVYLFLKSNFLYLICYYISSQIFLMN